MAITEKKRYNMTFNLNTKAKEAFDKVVEVTELDNKTTIGNLAMIHLANNLDSTTKDDIMAAAKKY